MDGELFSGLGELGWDRAPWEDEPQFSAAEREILLDRTLSVAEAAERVGCVRRDVEHLRRTA